MALANRFLPELLRGVLSLSLCFSFIGCAGNRGANGTVNATWSMEGKCHAVYNWVSQFQAEYPNTGRIPNNSDVANLYRDKFFVPVFGFTYEASNADRLRKTDLEVLYQCYGLGRWRNENYIKQLAPFKPFLDRGFYFNDQIASFVAERRKVEHWMQEVLAYTDRAQATQDYAKDLEQYVWIARRDLSMLWPSEQKRFLSQLEERQAVLAQSSMAPSKPSASASDVRGKPSPFPLARTIRLEDVVTRVRVFDSGQGFSHIPAEGFDYPDRHETTNSHDADDGNSLQRVRQWLTADGYSCTGSVRMFWNGLVASHEHQLSGEVRALIECRGDCRGIRYKAKAQSFWGVAIDIFGRSQPLPVLEFQGPVAVVSRKDPWSPGRYIGYPVYWTLSRPDARRDGPTITIYLWEQSTSTDERACKFTK